MAKFENSKWDKDKGVKEGSKADRARDAKEKARKATKDNGKVQIAAYRRSVPRGKK